MADIRAKTAALTSLEQLAAGHSLIHRVHPAAKLLGTAVYLLCLLSHVKITSSKRLQQRKNT